MEIAEDYRVLREAAGLSTRSAPDVLALAGPDRLRFLNGLVTCEVKSLAPGEVRYGLFTQLKGRILADVRILARDADLWLLLPPGAGATIGAHLEKYKLADRVEIAPVGGLAELELAGPEAAAVLARSGLPAPEPSAHAVVEVAGADVVVLRVADARVPHFGLLLSGDGAATVEDRLLVAGARAVAAEAWEALRIEEGRPVAGVDFGEDCFPQEAGLTAAVSFSKGCYLGQEVVARIHYRGGVKRRLRGILFPAGSAPAVGTAVLHDGREAGTVTSVAFSPRLGRPVGLAILHERAEPGGEVAVGDGTAVVVELPFADPHPPAPSPELERGSRTLH